MLRECVQLRSGESVSEVKPVENCHLRTRVRASGLIFYDRMFLEVLHAVDVSRCHVCLRLSQSVMLCLRQPMTFWGLLWLLRPSRELLPIGSLQHISWLWKF